MSIYEHQCAPTVFWKHWWWVGEEGNSWLINHVIFVLSLFDVVYHVAWFVYVGPSLCPWDELLISLWLCTSLPLSFWCNSVSKLLSWDGKSRIFNPLVWMLAAYLQARQIHLMWVKLVTPEESLGFMLVGSWDAGVGEGRGRRMNNVFVVFVVVWF